ncbi:Predicted membrane protein [Phaffia rhodozyma]|uniref:Golgi apparatus membrane protein TVP38 n=1 Tax=Phaffia rhodozyma TaxID=264483 RepID=A0A0F7SEN7_PHARH|nr:Predicted membrane protein [Phaffia rhodozyma]
MIHSPTPSRLAPASIISRSSSSSTLSDFSGIHPPPVRSSSIPLAPNQNPPLFSFAPSSPHLVGTTSNRPSRLSVDLSNLSSGSSDPSAFTQGRSSDINLSPTASRSNSPVNRFSLINQPSVSSFSQNSHQASHPSQLRHFYVPSITSTNPSSGSPSIQTSSLNLASGSDASAPPLSSNARHARPGFISHHSHLVIAPHGSSPEMSYGRWIIENFRDHQNGGWMIPPGLTPYVPFACWAATSLGFLMGFTFWRAELFSALDNLSNALVEQGILGQFIMGFLIFLTTFPPVPLYSTLIILSGYGFGAWTGFIISYTAALVGALVVFLLSRFLFRASMIRLLSRSPSLARVIHAIERKPSLLFLIRLAPYPYNLLNTLLASSRTLTLKKYTTITAISLGKLIIHTTVGSTIHNWGDYHSDTGLSDSIEGSEQDKISPEEWDLMKQNEKRGETLRKAWSIIGIILCIALFVYLTHVARRAVNDQTITTGSAPSSRSSSPVDTRYRTHNGGYQNIPVHDRFTSSHTLRSESDSPTEMPETTRLSGTESGSRSTVGTGRREPKDKVRIGSVGGMEDLIGFDLRGSEKTRL